MYGSMETNHIESILEVVSRVGGGELLHFMDMECLHVLYKNYFEKLNDKSIAGRLETRPAESRAIFWEADH